MLPTSRATWLIPTIRALLSNCLTAAMSMPPNPMPEHQMEHRHNRRFHPVVDHIIRSVITSARSRDNRVNEFDPSDLGGMDRLDCRKPGAPAGPRLRDSG